MEQRSRAARPSPRGIAVVLGSNGPKRDDQLKFAAQDAERVGAALRLHCGFRVRKMSARDPYQALRGLERASAQCTSADDFVIYFSGHGELLGKELFLLLDNTREPLFTSALLATRVLDALKQSAARNKLLILDCCHAGAASGLKGEVPVKELMAAGPSTLILCASDRLERARELDELQGSFLAHQFGDIVANATRLSITELTKELQAQASKHNRDKPTVKVPIPFLMGELRTDFLIIGNSDRATTSSPLPQEIYERLSAASAPLNSLSIRLSVSGVPTPIQNRANKAIRGAKRSIADLNDLFEHHNADDTDGANYIQAAMDRHVIQPFIRMLATDRFDEGYGMLALGLQQPLVALLAVGWVAAPDHFDMGPKGSLLPSGVLIGKEIEFRLQYEHRQLHFERVKTRRPTTTIELTAVDLALVMKLKPSNIDDAMLKYANTALTAHLPDEVVLFSWAPNFGEELYPDEDVGLPFNAVSAPDDLQDDIGTDPADLKGRPFHLQRLRLHLAPNGNERIAKTYELVLSSAGFPEQGPRGDDAVGYVRIWRGHCISGDLT